MKKGKLTGSKPLTLDRCETCDHFTGEGQPCKGAHLRLTILTVSKDFCGCLAHTKRER